MSLATVDKVLHVALVGNPNTGKSTLFNALAGTRQHVGNYPGVTVEKKIGRTRFHGQELALVDLPGTYSLSPHSPDEMVAVDVLLGRRDDVPPIDAVICTIDASNLERNLYLFSQVLDLGMPTVLALNMVDLAKARGMKIDVRALSERLSVEVVELEAHRRRGIDALKQAIARAVKSPRRAQQQIFPPEFIARVDALAVHLNNGNGAATAQNTPRYLVERLLLDTSGYLETSQFATAGPALSEHLRTARKQLAEAGFPVPAVEAMTRYQWIGSTLGGIATRPTGHVITTSDRIDRILTHRFWGTLIFAAIMLLLFSSIFVFADPLMGWLDGGTKWLGDQVESRMDEGALRSLLVSGVIGGVGSVLIFLPQILILFLFIAVLEDCGYMARAAFLMDKLMVKVGLSGKSFIPLLSSFACAIPGIMATRVIEDRRDRLTTIMVAPLMSCSARLPVYTLLIGMFISSNLYVFGFLPARGLVLFAMYAIGVIAAAGVALLLKRTVLGGPTPPFVMELPQYKWPSLRLVFYRMIDRGWAFLKRAGTLIFAVAIVTWALLYYPHDEVGATNDVIAQQTEIDRRLRELPPTTPKDDPLRQHLLAEQSRFNDPQQHDALVSNAMQRDSWLGRMGRWIEPVVKPLGWDWRIGSAVLASFPAREVVLGTLGVIFNLDDDVGEESGQTKLQEAFGTSTWHGSNQKLFTVPVALSVMVFFALCAQCAATLAVIRRETNSLRWPVFAFVYMTSLAYIAALATYQIGTWWAG